VKFKQHIPHYPTGKWQNWKGKYKNILRQVKFDTKHTQTYRI
jgi:hypothetical protein